MTRLTLSLALLSATSTFADIQYEMTSRATGGALVNLPIVGSRMKEPHTTVHYLKGNRMATVTKSTTDVWDLDAGTVTTINTSKKTYTVMTFEEMRKAMDDAMKQMQQASGKKADMDFTWKVSVQDPGDEKTVAGFKAHHFIMTMIGEGTDKNSGNTAGTKMIIDSWMAQDIPGMQEYHEFYKRMAEKMGIDVSSNINPMIRAQLGNGWDAAAKEMSKMKGFAVASVFKTISMANGQDVMVSENSQKGPSAGDVAKESVTGAVLGKLPGGLGGFGRKKKEETPAASSGGNMVPAVQMEFTTEMTNLVNGGFDNSVFAVPAGFKQVEDKRLRQ